MRQRIPDKILYPLNKRLPMLKKWLPAIGAAVALHLVVIFAFLDLHTPAKSTSESSQQNDNELTIPLPNSITESDTIDINQSMEDLLHEDLGDVDNKITNESDDVENEATTDKNLSETGDEQNPNIDKDTVNKNDKTDEDSNLINSAEEKTSNKQNQDSRKNDRQELARQRNGLEASSVPANAAELDNTIIDNQSTYRDRRLLSRDVPTAAQTSEVTEFEAISDEVEEINTQLSSTINTVKEQNRQQIAAIRSQQKEAYLQDKRTKVNEQVVEVGNQLHIDELAESEFSKIAPDTSATTTP